jgi:WD40 repeat protein
MQAQENVMKAQVSLRAITVTNSCSSVIIAVSCYAPNLPKSIQKFLITLFTLSLLLLTACESSHSDYPATVAAQSTEIARLGSELSSHHAPTPTLTASSRPVEESILEPNQEMLSLPVGRGTPIPIPQAAISPIYATQIVELARWGTGSVKDVAWSPDGGELLIASSIGIYRLASDTLQQRAFIDTTVQIETIAVSPDGRTLALGGDAGEVHLLELDSGRLLHVLSEFGTGPTVSNLTFSPDGLILAASLQHGLVRLWEVASGTELLALPASDRWLNHVAFSPDSTVIALATREGPIRLWEAASGKFLRDLIGHSSMVYSLAYSPDGTILASGAGDGTVKVWDPDDGKELITFGGFTGHVTKVAFSGDGTRLIATSNISELKAWITPSWQELYAFKGPAELRWRSISNSPLHMEHILVAVSNDRITLWDGSDGRERRTIPWLPGTDYWYTNAVFSPDNKQLALTEDNRLHHMQGWMLTREVRILDASTGGKIQNIWSGSGLTEVAISPDWSLLASGFYDGAVELREMATGQSLHTVAGHSYYVRSVAFSRDGQTLASASADKVILWDVASKQEITAISDMVSAVSSVAFSPDGLLLTLASDDQRLNLWDVTSRQIVHTLTGHEGGVTNVAFSPDGSLLASASADRTIKLWDVSSGQAIHTLSGHDFSVNGVTFSADGTLIASYSYRSIKIWDVREGIQLHTLSGHAHSVNSVAFSQDGYLLVTTSHDGTVRIWGVSP